MMRILAAAVLLATMGCAGPPPPQRLAPDQCGASSLQNLVGRKRSEIPPSVLALNPRIACTTCPVTQDYSPQRLNIFYDQTTEVINTVRCG